jgi:hypothetical protein
MYKYDIVDRFYDFILELLFNIFYVAQYSIFRTQGPQNKDCYSLRFCAKQCPGLHHRLSFLNADKPTSFLVHLQSIRNTLHSWP